MTHESYIFILTLDAIPDISVCILYLGYCRLTLGKMVNLNPFWNQAVARQCVVEVKCCENVGDALCAVSLELWPFIYFISGVASILFHVNFMFSLGVTKNQCVASPGLS